MWVRSQNGKTLIKISRLSIWKYGANEYQIRDYDILIGVYSTEEKALKVLDMIHERIAVLEHLKISGHIVQITTFVLKMPQDSEV